MIEIEDHREQSSWVPAIEVLQKAIPYISDKNLPGIRKVVLLDNDYHGKKDAGARYVPIQGTNRADIEMYFNHYKDIPKEIASNKIIIGMLIVSTLFHELYHHMVRFHKTKEQPSFEKEQRRADNWGARRTKEIITKIYPQDEFRKEYKAFKAINIEKLKENEANKAL
jgi:hypothetical protein